MKGNQGICRIMRTTTSVILLNTDYQVLNIVSFMRAVNLYLENKIRVLAFYENTGIIHPKLGIKKPRVAIMNRYIARPWKRIKLSRRNVLLRDDYVCQYCGGNLKSLRGTIDHIVPKSRKGSPGNIWTNVVAACEPCNNKKDDRTPEESGMRLLKKPFVPKVEHITGRSKEVRKLLEQIQKGEVQA